MRRAVLALLLCAPAFHADAQSLNGNTLLSRINGHVLDLANAYGYIAGVGDTLASDSVFCPPHGATIKQSTDIVRIFLEAHPAARHEAANDLIAAALITAFPCAKRRAKAL